jgi:DNA-directed RNA polymerase subunit L
MRRTENWVLLTERYRGGFMKVNILTKESNYIEIELSGEDHSFSNLLRETLHEDSDVEFVSYKLEHPQLASPKLYLRTTGKKPEKAINEALKKVRKRISDFQAALGKEKEHKEHKEKEHKEKKKK